MTAAARIKGARGLLGVTVGLAIALTGEVAGLSTARSSRCEGIVKEDESGLSIDCLNPCDDYCQVELTELGGGISTGFCRCTTGQVNSCCHVGLLLLDGTPVALASAGNCSTQQAGCPSGNTCTAQETILQDSTIYTPNCVVI